MRCVNRLAILGAAGVASVLASSGVAGASSVVNAAFPVPSIDRWMYVFNQTPGLETEARVFSPYPYEYGFFDNRDGQFLVAWETASASIPVGLPANHYRIVSARVKARVSGNNHFQFDATYDPYLSYPPSPPLPSPVGAIADADAGRPIELFACGFRNGYGPGLAPSGALPFMHSSPYTSGPAFPSVGNRTVFPAQFSSTGGLIDVSNNVDLGFEARPIAIGQTATNPFQPVSVNPGDLVPANTDMVFEIDVTAPESVSALRGGLSRGRVELVITSLALTSQGSSIVPRFYSRQWVVQNGPDPAAAPASLEMVVCVGNPADWNCSGGIEVQDIFDFLNDWFAGRGDYSGDLEVSVQDIFDFLNAWFAG